MKNKNSRLPCRGCMHNCKNYNTCNGALWRAPEVKLDMQKPIKARSKDNNTNNNKK